MVDHGQCLCIASIPHPMHQQMLSIGAGAVRTQFMRCFPEYGGMVSGFKFSPWIMVVCHTQPPVASMLLTMVVSTPTVTIFYIKLRMFLDSDIKFVIFKDFVCRRRMYPPSNSFLGHALWQFIFTNDKPLYPHRF